jgi:glycosyltransferase involved in cell wall biosynthesis
VRIAVNTRLLLKDRLEGIGWFTYEVLSRMVKAHQRHEFVFIFDRPWHPDFIFSDNIIPVAAFPPARHPLLWYAWFEYAVPAVLRRYSPDVFLSPDGYTSLRSKVPAITVIHDLNFEHFSGDMPLSYRTYYRHFTPKFARHSKRVLTVSEFTKTELVSLYKVPSSNIDVVYNGVQEGYVPLDAQEVKVAQERFAEGHPYMIFVGSLHPRKNITALLEAFSSLANREERLLMVGNKRWWTADMEAAARPLLQNRRLFMPGHLPPSDLYKAVAGARVMLYPSLFEGFGVPILEGMQAGVPVLTSNTTAMPEVAGGAALLCNPYNIDAIADGMHALLTDDNLRRQLIDLGRQRAGAFSWDETMRKTWEVLQLTG